MIPTHNVPVTNYPAVRNVDFTFEILLIFKLPHDTNKFAFNNL